MWMMPLHLHVNQKSDYDDMMNQNKSKVHLNICSRRKNQTFSGQNLLAGLGLTLYLLEMPFNVFANRADPDWAALVRNFVLTVSIFRVNKT